jgi:hypothetical protein
MNGWTLERRARQSAAIQQWRPWEHSTGAKTPQGKAKASRNAFKGGTRAILRELARLLREQGEALKRIMCSRGVPEAMELVAAWGFIYTISVSRGSRPRRLASPDGHGVAHQGQRRHDDLWDVARLDSGHAALRQ